MSLSEPSSSSTVSTNNSEYEKEITFSKKEFLEKVKASFNIDMDEIQLKIISYTASGRVSTLKIGEKSVKATALRKCLGLRSTDFIFEISELIGVLSITFFSTSNLSKTFLYSLIVKFWLN